MNVTRTPQLDDDLFPISDKARRIIEEVLEWKRQAEEDPAEATDPNQGKE